MVKVLVDSPEVKSLSLHTLTSTWTHIYALPFLCFYPLVAYAYYVKYDEWVRSEEWTFLYTVGLTASHALSFLITRWSSAARAWVSTRKASSLETATHIRVIPHQHRGVGEIVPILKRGDTVAFNYQRDVYTVAASDNETVTFERLPYPISSKPPLNQLVSGKVRSREEVEDLEELYGKNEFDIPIPTFAELMAEHAVAPFFVFQIFCVGLWCLDEYWYYSIFTLFMLVMFECTVVWQRLRTLKEFRTMSVEPYPIPVWRDGKWETLSSDLVVPGDIVGVSRHKSNAETTVPADILLLQGSVIVNEAMLSGESTPLLKESIALLPKDERIDVDGTHKGYVLFSGTKILQASSGGDESPKSTEAYLNPPGSGIVPGLVLRTGFGTSQGSLVRTMIFSTERVSANNLEAFLFIGFLLIFAIASSWYVWTKGLERDMQKGKLLLHCILIITSVVPPELPMELSLAVNASLVALSRYAIFCTEPFRIPFAGRVDVCCFDKTGTITAENLVLEGVGGVDLSNPKTLVNVKEASRNTIACLAAAHALVRLDDGTIVGDPMEKTTLENLGWELHKGDLVLPSGGAKASGLFIRRRFQFSSALKRMSTLSTTPNGGILAAVKGAPETIKGMLAVVPEWYDETYKSHTRQGSRVLALASKELSGAGGLAAINKMAREEVESSLHFVGFLVFSCPLKPDAVEVLKHLADSSHRCIMITGDNPLTAVHVAKDVEIVDRPALILDWKENATSETDLQWRTVDESKLIDVNPAEPLDESLFKEYDVCITGAAMKQFDAYPQQWLTLVQNTWVYARVSPTQKETILTSLKSLGYITLMAGDGTNDVGALKQAHIGVALLDGTEEDLKKIAEKQRIDKIKQVYESQLNITRRFNAPPPPVPPAIAHLFPEAVEAQKKAAADMAAKRKTNPMEKFDLSSITDKLSEMEDEHEAPKIKLGDASCAAPFTSKLSHVTSITHIIRQGRCTLVATIQMYKILALNCLISAYALSVQYLDGIKQGDYQLTVTGMLMSVCFLCISRAKPIDRLSKERPLGNIFNFYVLLSVLLQFALHIVSLVYITNLSHSLDPRGDGPIDLEADFEPSLLNTAIFLLSLSQQVSTFTINFQGRPFREGIRENRNLYYGLVGASAVAFSGSLDLVPELNRWLQVIEMTDKFKFILTAVMVIDFGGCWIIEKTCKYLFADLEPREMVTRGKERREARRIKQAEEAEAAAAAAAVNGTASAIEEKKTR
ncbi:hypothetical protein DL96DRAFT_1606032 [Flagelloscypha sp. PMI_526]|nr:hypothetical protein DL96DRAFT_1606032 [Flagelloscypha sp. PMI_526]